MTQTMDEKTEAIDEKNMPDAHVLQTMAENPEAVNAEVKEELEDTLHQTLEDMVSNKVRQTLSSGMKRPQMSEHNNKAAGAELDGDYSHFGEFAKAVIYSER